MTLRPVADEISGAASAKERPTMAVPLAVLGLGPPEVAGGSQHNPAA
jgi:hypothetical protein